MRFVTFWIDSDWKNFSTKIFRLCHYFTFGHFGKNDRVPRKKNLHGKKFQFRDFHFKIRFEIFWIHSDQKKIWTLSFFNYFGHFGRKTTVPRKEFYKILNFPFKIGFETFWIDSNRKNFLNLAVFHHLLPKNHVFGVFSSIFFCKKCFYLSFIDLIIKILSNYWPL